jgi:hypothetical protein
MVPIYNEHFPPDHPNLGRRETHVYGLGVFATGPIRAGEFISVFDGPIMCCVPSISDLSENPNGFCPRHAIQFDAHSWRDGRHDRMARYLAHSCEPNCGIRGLFEIVAIRDIESGEELTWDYAMTEKEHPAFECKCGSPDCRKVIAGFSELSSYQRLNFVWRYGEFISNWLVVEYGLVVPARRI